jgi:predicted amidohydrolase
VVSAELDLAALEEYRRALPVLGDMRQEEVRRTT